MISDTVILKPRPDPVQRSVGAYVGCLAGAIDKQTYIDLVKAAGFRDVEILEESPVSVDCMLNDPAAAAIMEEMKLTTEMVERLDEFIASIRLTGTKPN